MANLISVALSWYSGCFFLEINISDSEMVAVGRDPIQTPTFLGIALIIVTHMTDESLRFLRSDSPFYVDQVESESSRSLPSTEGLWSGSWPSTKLSTRLAARSISPRNLWVGPRSR